MVEVKQADRDLADALSMFAGPGFDFNEAEKVIAAHREAAEQAAAALETLRAERDEAVASIKVLLENEPDDPVSDAGHSVLDLWRHDARAFLTRIEGKDT